MNGSERTERLEAAIVKKESLNCRLLEALDCREILDSGGGNEISWVALKETNGSEGEEKVTEEASAHNIFSCKPLKDGENHANSDREISRVAMKENAVEEISQSERSNTFESAAILIQRRYRDYRAHKHGAAASSADKLGWSSVEDATRLQDNLEQFYSQSKTDTIAERWHRAVMKAAMVGKGLSKDAKALKLGLRHWLEAIDPKHRYGHNLCFYFEVWLKSPTREPFYYWLDIGEGKDVELEICSRSKLDKELVRYLDLKQREKYEVIIEDGKLFFKLSGKPVHTPKGDKWIFVMSPSEELYVAKKKKGTLQHSSFLSGGVTIAAGRLIVNNGILELIEAHSGHYLPKPENFQTLIAALTSSGADLTVAKVELESEEEVNKRTRGAVGNTANAIINHEKAFEVLLESAGFSLCSEKKPNIVDPDSTDNEEGSDDDDDDDEVSKPNREEALQGGIKSNSKWVEAGSTQFHKDSVRLKGSSSECQGLQSESKELEITEKEEVKTQD